MSSFTGMYFATPYTTLDAYWPLALRSQISKIQDDERPSFENREIAVTEQRIG